MKKDNQGAITALDDVESLVRHLAMDVQRGSAGLAYASCEQKNEALRAGAARLREQKATILQANVQDVSAARAEPTMTKALLDRLSMDEARLEAMAAGIETIMALPDPVGRVLEAWTTEGNGLHIQRVAVPLGVIGVIYESRPNVTADAAALCLKSGNGCLLRSGSESLGTSQVIVRCLQEGLQSAGLEPACVRLIPVKDRKAVGVMLSLSQFIDIIVPRGGESLIRRVEKESRIPVIRHLQGLCHTYIHSLADGDKVRRVAFNAKMRRPGICGATETILIDRDVVATLLPPLLEALLQKGCEVRGDADVMALDKRVTSASSDDWATEYLDAIVSIRTVAGIEEAIEHIARYGSKHTEAIITEDKTAAGLFMARVDAAIVMHNTSTQFADGGEFGMGAEIGISTNKLHARGPVGAQQLTSYKYCVVSDGSVRP
ncbi:MAG: glutamate-5-semialdehyde dehydrogenase [Alphaproteobacteria bacterium GM202ARS2]|nr:glutamate-5-semialdehyde dehydrogenase [Alphaproteobacteria bacterium GM202ARS2]